MGAAFHERDTHVTAKCNVCFEGVNAAGSATKIRHAAARGANGDSACGDKGIAYARRGPAERYATQRLAIRRMRPNSGIVTENGTMGPFCRVNNSRKAEWSATRNTFCLMGDNINFIAKLRPAKNRPHSRHSWHRNTIPVQ